MNIQKPAIFARGLRFCYDLAHRINREAWKTIYATIYMAARTQQPTNRLYATFSKPHTQPASRNTTTPDMAPASAIMIYRIIESSFHILFLYEKRRILKK